MPRSKEGKVRVKVPTRASDIEAAANKVISKNISVRQAALAYNVPRTTLLRHLTSFNASNADVFVYKANNAVKKVFEVAEELLLVEYLKTAAALHYGLTVREVRKLAFQFAKANMKTYPPTWDANQEAGNQWFRYFMTTYKNELSLRKPEATSLSRLTSFNKTNVQAFFANYERALSKGKFPPHRVWNVDETGISTVHAPPKIIAGKGVKQVGSMTSGERGINTTMIGAICATGNHIPPFMIFPRVNFKSFMIKGAPTGTIGAANQSGWSNEDLFAEWLEHFIAHTKPSLEDPILLLLDNHDSHTSLKVICRAKEVGITLLTFPPHTSHKFQPLDRTVFGPFKTYYNTACNNWMLLNPGKPISIYEVAELVGTAFPLSFTTSNIQKGFEVSGIVPLNVNIFTDDEFLGSYVTDRPCPDAAIDPGSDTEQMDETNSTITSMINVGSETSNGFLSTDPSTKTLSPQDIRPFAKAAPRKAKSAGRKRGKSTILTDTPEKNAIEEQHRLKSIKSKKPGICKVLVRPKSKKLKKAIIITEEDQLSDYDEDRPRSSQLASACASSTMKDSVEDPADANFKAGNWVVVQYPVKKSNESKCCVGQIINRNRDDTYKVTFVRHIAEYRFRWPMQEDVDFVSEDMFFKRLNDPSVHIKNDRVLCLIFDNCLRNLQLY